MNDQRGFSLVELMAVVALSALIGYGVYMCMNTEEMQRQTSALKMNIQDSAREGLYKMVQEIRLSAPGRVTISVPSAGFEVIEFQIPNASTPVNTDSTDDVTDFSTDWDSAQTIQYARGGTSCDKIIRTLCAGGVCPPATCPCSSTCTDTLTTNQSIVARNVSSLDFDNTTYSNTVILSMSVQDTLRTRGDRNLMVTSAGASAPLQMTAKANLRNS